MLKIEEIQSGKTLPDNVFVHLNFSLDGIFGYSSKVFCFSPKKNFVILNTSGRTNIANIINS